MTTSSASEEQKSIIKSVVDVASVREYALHAGQLAPFIGQQYSIFILDTKTNKVLVSDAFKNLNPASPNVLPEYFFEVPPNVQELGEPFSTNIVATQRGGKFVESHGSIIKNIIVRGTTGLRPRKTRGEFSNIPLIGETINDLTQQFRITDARRGVKPSEQTGFDDITFLKNLFRAYSDVKENNEPSNHIVMVWRNHKDQDSWIVEPLDFRVTRSSKSPLTYEYTINFKTLTPYASIFTPPEDPLSTVLAVRKVFSRVAEFNQSLRRSFLIVSTQIRRLEGLGVWAQTQLLSPFINVTRGLGIIRATGSTFGVRLKHNAQVLANELDEATALLAGSPAVEPQDALLRSLRRARITCSRILVEPGLRESAGSEGSTKHDRYVDAYVTLGSSATNVASPPTTGGSTTYLGNVPNVGKLAEDKVQFGEDIRSLAGRLLKNKSSWHILVTINQLSSPYITPDGEGDTLAPGDTILYPVSSNGADAGTLNIVNISDDETDDTLTPVHNAYGRDLRLRSVSTAPYSEDLADLMLNSRGDLSTVVGVPNVEQAIMVKFSTEGGELPAHPLFGASFPIGKKMSFNAINDFRTQTEATIYSDGRVRAINTLDFRTNGDILLVKANLKLINSNDSLNLTVPLQAF